MPAPKYHSPESISSRQGVQLQKLSAEVQALRAHNVALQAALNLARNAEDELADYKRRLIAAQSRMQIALDRRELYLGEQIADDKIQGGFIRLQGLVKRISINFLVTTPDPGSSEAALNPLFNWYQRDLDIEQLREFMFDPTHRRFRKGIIRGYIAHRTFMYATRLGISSSTHDAWLAPELASALARLEDLMNRKRLSSTSNSKLASKSITIEEVNEWRARTCFLLEKVVPPDVDHSLLLRLAKDVVTGILPWAPAEKAGDILNHTMTLVSRFIKFAQLLRRQRAHWTVSPGKAISVPNWSRMQDEDAEMDYEQNPKYLNSNARVLTLFPALMKQGNEIGEMYSEETCIEKAQVHTFVPQYGNEAAAERPQAARSDMNRRTINGAHVPVGRVQTVDVNHFETVSSSSRVGYDSVGRISQGTQISAYTRSGGSTSASLPVQRNKAPRIDQSSFTNGTHIGRGEQVRHQSHPVPDPVYSYVNTPTLNAQASYLGSQNTANRHTQALAKKDVNERRSIDLVVNAGDARRSVDQAPRINKSIPGASTQHSDTSQKSSQARSWFKGSFWKSSSKSSTDRQGSGPSESSITVNSVARPRTASFDVSSRQARNSSHY